MAAAIEVRGLEKTYHDQQGRPIHAVRGIDLDVQSGEVLAFLGANGAGKTTTIEILEGFRSRSAGSVQVLGHDPQTAPRSWREDVGIVLQESEPDADLTARESLQMFASYYEAPRDVDATLALVGLADHHDQRTKRLSGGQKRRLDLATALIGDPRLVFLDEPTTGFDPSARRDAWAMIGRLRDLGVTVLLTTHYMDEAEALSDRIVVINNGVIAASGTAADLATKVKLATQITWDINEVGLDALPEATRDLVVVDATGQARLETDDVARIVLALTNRAVDLQCRFDSLSVIRPNLEDTFLRLTGDDDR